MAAILKSYAMGPWPILFSRSKATFLEVFTLLSLNPQSCQIWQEICSTKTWIPELRNKSVQIYTDNTQVFHMVRKGVSSNTTCMAWLRELFWVCKIYRIRLVPHYINTKNNLVADTLSHILYIKSELEIRKCLEGSNLFKLCRG